MPLPYNRYDPEEIIALLRGHNPSIVETPLQWLYNRHGGLVVEALRAGITPTDLMGHIGTITSLPTSRNFRQFRMPGTGAPVVMGAGAEYDSKAVASALSRLITQKRTKGSIPSLGKKVDPTKVFDEEFEDSVDYAMRLLEDAQNPFGNYIRRLLSGSETPPRTLSQGQILDYIFDNTGLQDLQDVAETLSQLPRSVRDALYTTDPLLVGFVDRINKSFGFENLQAGRERELNILQKEVNDLYRPDMVPRSAEWWNWRLKVRDYFSLRRDYKSAYYALPEYDWMGEAYPEGWGEASIQRGVIAAAAEDVDSATRAALGISAPTIKRAYNAEYRVTHLLKASGLVGPQTSVLQTPLVMSSGQSQGSVLEVVGHRIYSQQDILMREEFAGRTGITGPSILVRTNDLDKTVMRAMGIEDIAIVPFGGDSGILSPLHQVSKMAHQDTYNTRSATLGYGDTWAEKSANLTERVEEIGSDRIERASRRLSNQLREIFRGHDQFWASEKIQDNIGRFLSQSAPGASTSDIAAELLIGSLWEITGKEGISARKDDRALNTLHDILFSEEGELSGSLRAAFSDFLGEDAIRRISGPVGRRARLENLYTELQKAVASHNTVIPRNQMQAKKFFIDQLNQSGLQKTRQGISTTSLDALMTEITDEGRIISDSVVGKTHPDARAFSTEADFVQEIVDRDEIVQRIKLRLNQMFGSPTKSDEASLISRARQGLDYMETHLPVGSKLRVDWMRYEEGQRLEFMMHLLETGRLSELSDPNAGVGMLNILDRMLTPTSKTSSLAMQQVLQRFDFSSALRHSVIRGVRMNEREAAVYRSFLKDHPLLGTESEVLEKLSGLSDQFDEGLSFYINIEKILTQKGVPKAARTRIINEMFGKKTGVFLSGIPIGPQERIAGTARPTYRVDFQLPRTMTVEESAATHLGEILEDVKLRVGDDFSNPAFVEEFIERARAYGRDTLNSRDALTLYMEHVDDANEFLHLGRDFDPNKTLKALRAYFERVVKGADRKTTIDELMGYFEGKIPIITAENKEIYFGAKDLESMFRMIMAPSGGMRIVPTPDSAVEPVLLKQLHAKQLQKLAENTREPNLHAVLERSKRTRGALITDLLNPDYFGGDESAAISAAWEMLERELNGMGYTTEQFVAISRLMATNMEGNKIAGLNKALIDSLDELSKETANATSAISRVQYMHRLYAPFSYGTLIQTPDSEYGRALGDMFGEVIHSIGRDGAQSQRATELIRLIANALSSQSKMWGEKKALNIFRATGNPVFNHIVDQLRPGGTTSTTPLLDQVRHGLRAGNSAGEAEAVAETVDRIGLKEGWDILKREPLVKGIGVGAAILAALGIYRSTKKDPTPEDAAGPPYLPGGSFYENPANIPMSPVIPISNPLASPGGIDYVVNASGDFDPNNLGLQMSSFSGARPMGTHYYNRLQSPVERRQSLERGIIDNY